jgi:sn-glycerol 3-phosphate transport system ATP-binding protein
MNLFDGAAGKAGEVMLGGVHLAVPHAGLAEGRPVTIGIRPEEVVFGSTRPDVPTIDVDFTEELGAQRLLHGQVAGHDFVIQVPAASPGPRTGRFPFEVPARAVHLFDAETGTRIEPDPARVAAAA